MVVIDGDGWLDGDGLASGDVGKQRVADLTSGDGVDDDADKKQWH